MPALPFSKWSPGGNTTLLFPAGDLSMQEQTRLAVAALDAAVLGGEQAGFFDAAQKKLRMAGGEFCVNASRAAGALLACLAAPSGPEQGVLYAHAPAAPGDRRDTAAAPAREDEILVSGWETPIRLRTRGKAPCWRVEAVLRLPSCPVERAGEGVHLVRLPGICHLLLDGGLHPLPEDCCAAAAALRRRHGLDREPAAGVIWWRERRGQLEMLPVVHVRDADTTCLENACGSGALALALCLTGATARGNISVMQPGGSALDVRLFSEGNARMAGVDGPVGLVAQGRVWLPDAGDAAGARA